MKLHTMKPAAGSRKRKRIGRKSVQVWQNFW